VHDCYYDALSKTSWLEFVFQYSTAGVSKLFCPRTTQVIPQQFKSQTSYVMRLFWDMLYSSESLNYL